MNNARCGRLRNITIILQVERVWAAFMIIANPALAIVIPMISEKQ